LRRMPQQQQSRHENATAVQLRGCAVPAVTNCQCVMGTQAVAVTATGHPTMPRCCRTMSTGVTHRTGHHTDAPEPARRCVRLQVCCSARHVSAKIGHGISAAHSVAVPHLFPQPGNCQRQLLRLIKQGPAAHKCSGWGVHQLYLLARAFQYRYIDCAAHLHHWGVCVGMLCAAPHAAAAQLL
jgi:hypothetical protein